jgi:hypothetical protein
MKLYPQIQKWNLVETSAKQINACESPHANIPICGNSATPPLHTSKSHIGSEPPKTTESEPPNTVESEPPKTTESEPPKMIESEPPNTIESEPPKTIQSEPSKMIESEPPNTIESEPPNAIQSEPPNAIQSEPPKMIESEPPNTTQSEPPKSIEYEAEVGDMEILIGTHYLSVPDPIPVPSFKAVSIPSPDFTCPIIRSTTKLVPDPMTQILAFVPNFESFFLAQRSPSGPLLPHHHSYMNGTIALSEELSPNEDPFFSMISAPGGVLGISTTPTANMIHASIPLLSSSFNGVGNFNAMSMIQAHAENGGILGMSTPIQASLNSSSVSSIEAILAAISGAHVCETGIDDEISRDSSSVISSTLDNVCALSENAVERLRGSGPSAEDEHTMFADEGGTDDSTMETSHTDSTEERNPGSRNEDGDISNQSLSEYRDQPSSSSEENMACMDNLMVPVIFKVSDREKQGNHARQGRGGEGRRKGCRYQA